jgi:hypothetical protein
MPGKSTSRAADVLPGLPGTGRVEDALGRGWVAGEFVGWTPRTNDQVSPAVRTLPAKNRVGARRAEGALE